MNRAALFAKQISSSTMTDSKTKETILITGANRGIGLSLAKTYKRTKPDACVIGTWRNPKDAEELEKAGCFAIELDVESDDSCISLMERLKSKLHVEKLDLLVNNAGVLKRDSLDRLDFDALEKQFKVNALGPLKVTKALLPLLKESAKTAKSTKTKIVNMSSRMGSIGDNTSGTRICLPKRQSPLSFARAKRTDTFELNSGSYYGYRASKSAINQISVTLARDLMKDNIVVLCLHPGNIKTDMNSYGDMTPDECAERLAKLVESKNLPEDGLKFWHRDGMELPW